MTISAIKAKHAQQKEDKRYCRSHLTCGEVDELVDSHSELVKCLKDYVVEGSFLYHYLCQKRVIPYCRCAECVKERGQSAITGAE